MPFTEINSKMVEATVAPGQKLYSQRGRCSRTGAR